MEMKTELVDMLRSECADAGHKANKVIEKLKPVTREERGCSMKKNCWEFKSCGREPGGRSTGELGVCPATVDRRLHGIHEGTNAGRACWVIAGTLCGGKIQGTFAQKYENCGTCDFYQSVRSEERGNHKLSITLLNHLRAAD